VRAGRRGGADRGRDYDNQIRTDSIAQAHR
jgi:hypothetical protein